MKRLFLIFWSILLVLLAGSVSAQPFTLKGKVIDAQTGDAIPFANVYPKSNPAAGITTDFDGYYTLKLTDTADSIVVSYVGYIRKAKSLAGISPKDGTYLLNFQLEPDEIKLTEIVVKAGEDPAYPIMRRVIANASRNDKRSLAEYECETYTKIEIDMDNISDRFAQRKIIKKVNQSIDSVGRLTGEDGKPLLPLFLSEALSKYHFRRSPERIKEIVLNTKVEGIGFDDNSAITQILGSSFQEYNFYKNYVNVLNKDFASPIGDAWRFFYNFYLQDSLKIGDDWCYKIEVEPKRPQDLAFVGYIWIERQSYALRQIDVTITRAANINFIDKIKIQQEHTASGRGPWIPVKTRVMVDVAQLTPSSAGFLGRFYTSSRNFVYDKSYPLKFYDENVEVRPEAKFTNKDFWAQNRHDSLSAAEFKSYEMIDQIKQVSVVKTYTKILEILSSGYLKIGKIDFGPYPFTYALNDVEGHRFRLGFRTNELFSRWLEFKGYGAYGTLDQRWKYGARLRFLPSRRPWTEFAFEHTADIVQVAANPNAVQTPQAFVASLNFFNVSRRSPFWREQSQVYFQTDIFKGYRQTIRLINSSYQQIGTHFAYLTDPTQGEASPMRSDFTTTDLVLEARFAKQESFFYTGNQRLSLGTAKLPIVTLRYTLGINHWLNSDFSYQRFDVGMEQRLRLGVLGNAYYALTASYTPSTIPYPLLEVHLGNRGYFYNFYGFGLMNFLEFVSDRHISLNFEHNFDGLLTNRLPLLRRYKLRTFAAANVLWGSLSQQNKALIPATDPLGDDLVQPRGLGNEPYLELGYGIDNILRFFRVTFLHRLSYQQNPNIRKFGVFLSARFNL